MISFFNYSIMIKVTSLAQWWARWFKKKTMSKLKGISSKHLWLSRKLLAKKALNIVWLEIRLPDFNIRSSFHFDQQQLYQAYHVSSFVWPKSFESTKVTLKEYHFIYSKYLPSGQNCYNCNGTFIIFLSFLIDLIGALGRASLCIYLSLK